ncbi:helix-turn-helix domain-containing protein [Nocardia cyriacigeorgica]|uniref:helix-turn-helix domain-containing protein n=1 Tax=Nocardia cyriacigeorgica TaxID=135487 RepID=UPI001894E977|nr:helix-turn-helix transcriptional regulator [Nocardia cyriacigeorgica]MBF6437788.1 helix-turn-helix transcriptional regulator [Nocardia cyriacigeorgica]MBF6453350.1 helix-turn-helix transcriptional regulator [Nocardia cyriacigeorgica]MBF6478632.1 helix-turn-helix transcriptional regulator [Nocardia cyriacigeorgica]MBF6550519.1 helix-turn-helix transcriptional regulator [Nocardia cyriacigeorgica]
MAPVSPTVARWELVLRLRELREQRGYDSAGFAKLVGFTPANWSHVEKGRRVLTTNTIGPVLDQLEVEPEERAELLELLRASKQRGWWAKSSALIGSELQRLYGMEYGAQSIRSYDSSVVPGLLQTEAYARALISADVMIRPVQVEQLVAIRMQRQRRLRGQDPVELTAVVGEGTLRQQTGGPDVLAAQLRHLVDLMTELGNVEVRVIPFTASAGAVLGGSSFHLIDFTSERLPTFGWAESAVFGGAVDDPEQVRDLSFAFVRALEQSLSRDDSLSLLRRYMVG